MQFGGDVEPADYMASGAPYVMLSSLKHYNAYSLETNRMSSQANVTLFDLWETYLPQYERPMTRAAAAGTVRPAALAALLLRAKPRSACHHSLTSAHSPRRCART
jgi:hypothetical protein